MIRYTTALVLSVCACAWIAVFYRPTNTYLNKLLLGWIGVGFLDIRETIQITLPLGDLLVYTFPGAFWVFGGSLLGWRLRLGIGHRKIHLFYLPIIFGVGFEFTQFTGITDGTFDWLDLLFVLLAFGFAVLFCRFILPDTWRANPGRWRYVLFFIVLLGAYSADVWH